MSQISFSSVYMIVFRVALKDHELPLSRWEHIRAQYMDKWHNIEVQQQLNIKYLSVILSFNLLQANHRKCIGASCQLKTSTHFVLQMEMCFYLLTEWGSEV